MTPDEKYMKAIADCNKRTNTIEQKLDAFFKALHEKNAADIEYLAMMADIDIDEGDSDDSIS